jgi:hypothetical protein
LVIDDLIPIVVEDLITITHRLLGSWEPYSQELSIDSARFGSKAPAPLPFLRKSEFAESHPYGVLGQFCQGQEGTFHDLLNQGSLDRNTTNRSQYVTR